MWVIGNFAEAKHWREAGVCPLKQGNPVGEVALGEDRGEYLSAFSPGGCVILALQEADRRTDHLEKLVVELRLERSDSDFASIPALIGSIEGCTPKSEEHTSELQSLMRISYAVFCLKQKHTHTENQHTINTET